MTHVTLFYILLNYSCVLQKTHTTKNWIFDSKLHTMYKNIFFNHDKKLYQLLSTRPRAMAPFNFELIKLEHRGVDWLYILSSLFRISMSLLPFIVCKTVNYHKTYWYCGLDYNLAMIRFASREFSDQEAL